jgi:NADH-quinone oxidoreductase subunit H
MVSIGVYGIMLGGWASNNKYALLGAIRAASQMVSYELAMGLSIVALVMLTGTLSLSGIVLPTAGGERLGHHPPAFRLPDLHRLRLRRMQPRALRPARVRDRTGGRLPHGVQQHEARLLPLRRIRQHVHQQCRHRHALSSAARCAGPLLADLGLDPEPGDGHLAHGGLLREDHFFFIFFFMWIRWTIPRFRFDQLMNLGWKRLDPAWASSTSLVTGGLLLPHQRLLRWPTRCSP